MFFSRLARRRPSLRLLPTACETIRRRQLRLEPLEERALLAALYVDTTPGGGNTIFTPTGGSQVRTPGLTLGVDLFTSISAAVAAANPSDTINVADGTYSELVTVNKALTIRGNQFGVDARTRGVVPESVVNGTIINAPFRTTAFYITAANVTIDGFTSRDQTDGNVFNAGIVLGPANTIVNNIITNNVIGIAGIVSSTSVIAQNLFDANNNPGPAGGTAIYTENSTNWIVDNNEFRNHTANTPVIFAAVGAGVHTNLSFTNNSLHDNLSGVYALGIAGGLFQGNTVRTSPAATGLTFAGANTAIDVLRNDLSPNARRLRITDFRDPGRGTPNSDIEAHFNSFANNTQFGAAILNGGFGDPYSSPLLDLTCNWWGNVTGPTSAANPGGAGAILQNDFADNIDFQPWLLYDDASAPQVGFQIPASFTVNAQLGGFTTTNNNYRRLVNAIDCLQSGQTVTLSGQFDWTEANAAASWALGNDGVLSAADDFSLLVPANVNGVTLTAGALGAARISGPGDLATVNLEGFLVFDGGDNQNWTISNLEIFNFDLGLGFFNGAGGSDAFNNTHILNNRIRIPRDLNVIAAPADVNQNIGIHFSFGTNQVIQGNFLDIEGDGLSSGLNTSSTVGMQSNTSGGNVYDGLVIDGNILTVLNAQSAAPARILGIWENAHGHSSNITVSNNQFLNAAPGNDAALNLQRAFRVTSHSSPTSTVAYTGNTVQGANIGFEWISGSNFAGNLPVRLWQNTLTGNNTGVLIQSSGLANLYHNTITGSLATGVNLDSGQLGPSGPVTRAVQENFISGGAVGLRLNAGTAVNGGIFNNQLTNTVLSINNLTGSLVDASG